MTFASENVARKPAAQEIGPAIKRASVDDASKIARLFAAAFARDPVFDWLARAGSGRQLALQRFFFWTLRERTIPHGETWIAQDGLAAAAWIPPHLDMRTASLKDELGLLPVILRLTGIPRVARGAAMAAVMEQSHPKEPYHYLAFIGVAPRCQGAGLGAGLLEHTLARVDAASGNAYLENSNPRNVRFYERAGFSVIREVKARKDAPPLFAMWRPKTVYAANSK